MSKTFEPRIASIKSSLVLPTDREKAEFSSGELFTFLENKAKELGKENRVFLLVYKYNEVRIEEIKNHTLSPEQEKTLGPGYLRELRMFSQIGEFYTWKHEETFRYRLRIDENETKDEPNIYEETPFMWGQNVKKKNNCCIAYEKDRGMEIPLPFEVNAEQLPLRYLVRNYFNYDEHGQIHFYDARLVKFLNQKGEEIYNG
jgi:CRISPR-associated protein (TIGR03984 family)